MAKGMDRVHHVTSWRSQVVLVVALFFIRFIETGVVKSFGVLLGDLVVQLDSDLGRIGLILASFHGVACLLGPIVASTVSRLHLYQILGISVFAGLFMCASSMATNIGLFATFFICSGICFSFVRSDGIITFKRRFPPENFALGYGICDTGSSVGIMFIPLLVDIFRNLYGFRGALLLTGGLILHSAPALYVMHHSSGSTDHPISEKEAIDSSPGGEESQPLIEQDIPDERVSVNDEGHNSTNHATERLQREKGWDLKDTSSSINSDGTSSSVPVSLPTEKFDTKDNNCTSNCVSYLSGWAYKMWDTLDLPSIKRNHTFMLYFVYRFLGSVTATAWVIFLIPHGMSKGLLLERATLLAILGGFGNGLGRLVQGPIIHKEWMTSIDLLIASTITNGIVFLLDPLANSFAILAVNAFICGLTLGCRTTAGMVFLAGHAPEEAFAAIYGWSGLFYGLGEPIGGLLTGWISERLSFEHAFMAVGGVEIVAVLFLLGLRQSTRRLDNEGK